MKKVYIFCLTMAALAACNSSKKGLFGSITPHEKYGNQIREAGLASTVIGSSWFTAADKSLNAPLQITLPFREAGYFESSAPSSRGYRFDGRRGQQLIIQLDKKPATGFRVFVELWKQSNGSNTKNKLLESVDTTALRYELDEDGVYNVRMQPELLAGGSYEIAITTAPSLRFPVQSARISRIGSFWGDARDAGARSHEGIDIFGPLRTPVVAAANGTVYRVGNNNLGGKVIFLRPDDRDFSLYYAHLDSQLVREGQRVMAGEVLGLMGKTGNARNTPVHLHFGIYARGGAVDPFPFVNPDIEKPAAVGISNYEAMMNKTMIAGKSTSTVSSKRNDPPTDLKIPEHTVLTIIGASANRYRVLLPDGTEGYISAGSVRAPLQKTMRVDSAQRMTDRPFAEAGTRKVLAPKDEVKVMGYFDRFAWIEKDNVQGWIAR